jgi:hypothetical protein
MSIQLQYHVPLTMQYFLVSVLFLTTIARSAPLNATKSCKEYSLPLNVTSLNLKWALGPFESTEDMANFNANSGRRDAGSTFHPFTRPTVPETAVYTISGTFCEPASGGNGNVLLATHGGGYDR